MGEWDGSTNCGEDREVDYEAKSVAESVLESAPQIRAVHSKESVQRIIEKQREQAAQGPVDLVAHMAKDGPMLAPVITASEDTQTRLHKPVDPSMLPYLYRSPAV